MLFQNFNKPTASVAPCMAASASDMSASNTLEKSYRDMDKNIKPSYYDTHKIQNGTGQLKHALR